MELDISKYFSWQLLNIYYSTIYIHFTEDLVALNTETEQGNPIKFIFLQSNNSI